jgi:hypothetical protein
LKPTANAFREGRRSRTTTSVHGSQLSFEISRATEPAGDSFLEAFCAAQSNWQSKNLPPRAIHLAR